jgi:hypothetical protein
MEAAVNLDFSNTIIERLPKHLKQFIVPQDYDQYTPIDQAVWRFVMRKKIRSNLRKLNQ